MEAKDNVMDDVVFVLIGTKIDLDEERVVDYDRGMKLMEELDLDLFFETSAKKNMNVDQMFKESTEKII